MTPSNDTEDQDNLTAISFLIRLWEERLFLILITFFFVALASIYIIVSPSKYTTTILVGHVPPIDNPGSSSASGLNGALSLFGAGGGTDTKFDLFFTIIKTESFAHYLELGNHFIGQMQGSEHISDMQALIELLQQINVAPDTSNNTTKLSLQIQNKDFAKKFLTAVYEDGNQAVRQLDTQRAEHFASYIEDRFRSEPNRAMQDALASLLVTQERFLMVTKVNLPYAVELLDGPTASIRPTSPRKSLLLVIGFFVGLAMGVAGILVWDAVAEERRNRGLPTLRLSDWIGSRFRFLKQKPPELR